MKSIRMLAAAPLAGAAALAHAATPLYGVGWQNQQYAFSTIDTTTGLATPQFTFTVPGTTSIQFLTYVPVTGKFLTVGQVDAFNSVLVEIDPGAQTATTVLHGIPTSYFEGLEYSAANGGVVASYGPGGFFAVNLALLDPTNYSLMASNSSTTMFDCDIVYEDGNGLGMIDANNFSPTGFQRNSITNPFGSMSLAPVGANIWDVLNGEADVALKADEGRFFATQISALAEVNGSSTLITQVGAYGGSLTITGIAAIPEPGTLTILAAGAWLLRRGRAAR